jgi:type III pantothenate kinase
MLLLLDIGNTHTHIGLASSRRVLAQLNFPTAEWLAGEAPATISQFTSSQAIAGNAFCSVVPKATACARQLFKQSTLPTLELSHTTVRGVGIDYPEPKTIGPDRLANAVAARAICGAPVVVVDFGTAVTFDVVDAAGNYVGGIIAPGLNAMTDYLHEKTALLPRIKIVETSAVIGKSTTQAMLIGAVHGYRGLVRELIGELERELDHPELPVVATGGYAKLMAARLPEITWVLPNLTLEGLRCVWLEHFGPKSGRG